MQYKLINFGFLLTLLSNALIFQFHPIVQLMIRYAERNVPIRAGYQPPMQLHELFSNRLK